MGEVLYGFYSARAADKHGTVFYQDTEGNEVEVSAVLHNPDGEGYFWDDKVLVGPVVKWIRRGKKGSELDIPRWRMR